MVFVGLICSGLTAVASAAEYKEGEVIVKYKKHANRSRNVMNVLYTQTKVDKVRHFRGILSGYEQLYLEKGAKVEDAIATLKANTDVEYAQPNYMIYAYPAKDLRQKATEFVRTGVNLFEDSCTLPWLPCKPAEGKPALNDPPAEVNPPVADPEISKAYGLTKIGAVSAWNTSTKGDKNFVVAVIDTGIDYNHEDLAFNVWRNPNPKNNDITGYDFVHDDGMPFDDNEHGTHTSGTVGAVGGNGLGVSGVNQRVSIMGLKFLNKDGSGTSADAIRAIDYAIEHGAKVLSNSWGGHGDDGQNQALYDAIERAKAKDVLFIAAAGNESVDNDGNDPAFPASFNNDNLIAVAATDKNDTMASFSNWGKKSVHLAAPGVGVYSTVPGNQYASFSGTSMACPHVAGAAALLWSKNPSWNYKKVKEVLMSTVDAVQELSDKTVTGGRLNIAKALATN
jgi:subtilisin family serine protease